MPYIKFLIGSAAQHFTGSVVVAEKINKLLKKEKSKV
jgi:hypothetical protein